MTSTPRDTQITIDKVELDLWADIYCKARLAQLCTVTLSEFLQRPYDYLNQSGQSSALDCLENGYLPLMPEQVRTATDLQAVWASGDEKPKVAPRHLQLVHSTRHGER